MVLLCMTIFSKLKETLEIKNLLHILRGISYRFLGFNAVFFSNKPRFVLTTVFWTIITCGPFYVIFFKFVKVAERC